MCDVISHDVTGERLLRSECSIRDLGGEALMDVYTVDRTFAYSENGWDLSVGVNQVFRGVICRWSLRPSATEEPVAGESEQTSSGSVVELS